MLCAVHPVGEGFAVVEESVSLEIFGDVAHAAVFFFLEHCGGWFRCLSFDSNYYMGLVDVNNLEARIS